MCHYLVESEAVTHNHVPGPVVPWSCRYPGMLNPSPMTGTSYLLQGQVTGH